MYGFGGPGWYRSVDTVYEKLEEHILEAEPLAVGTGEVESAVGKAKRLGVFVEVLRYS